MNDTLQIVLATLTGATVAGIATLSGAALGSRWGHVRGLRADLYLDLLPKLEQSYRDSGFRDIDDDLALRVARSAIAAGGQLRRLGVELGGLVFDYRHSDRKEVVEKYMKQAMSPGTASIASEVNSVGTQMMGEAAHLLQPAGTRRIRRFHYRLGRKWPRYRRVFRIPPPRI